MKRAYPFPDYTDWESTLSSEQRQIMSSVRDFVTKEVRPLIREAYANESFPLHLAPKMGELGLFGSTLTSGMDNVSYGLMMRELERCDSGLRSFSSVQSSLVMFPIHEFGSDEQKREWLPKLGRGEAIGCFGLTESEGGSDPSAMKTTAADRGDHWEINGSKMWITNGNPAAVAIVWAKTENGIKGFLIPTATSGFKAVKMQGKLSLRASITSELYFDKLKVPKTALLPKSDGLKSALMCLNQARFGIAWGAIGAAEACFDEAARYVQERVVFKKKLAQFQLVQQKLARMVTDITLAQLLVLHLGRLKDAGQLHHSQVSMAKQNNVEMALRTARVARDILGANGIMDEYPVMRHMCNLETVFTYEGTNDIHLLIVGKEITGVDAFS